MVETIGAVFGRKRVVFTSRKIPIRTQAWSPTPFDVEGHDVTRRQQAYAFEQRQVGKDVLERKILVQGRIRYPARYARMFEDGFYFRGKYEDVVLAIPIERFHAVAIARQKQFFLFSIKDGKSKHPVEIVHAFFAPFLISVNNDFSVGA